MPFAKTFSTLSLSPYLEFFGSLRFRLSFWNTTVMLLMVVATLVGVREGLRLALLREVDQVMLEDSAELGITVAECYPDMDRIGHELERKVSTHGHHKLYIKLMDGSGSVLWKGGTIPDPPLLPNSRVGAFAPQVVGTHRLMQHRISGKGLPPLTLRVGFSLDPINADVAKLTNLVITVGVLAMLVAPIGGYWLAGRATRPIAEIIDTTARLHPTQLDERLKLRGTRDELDRLSETINGFLDRIGAYLAQNREFTANAAHELRSPLAAIQSSLEVALGSERTVEEYKEVIDLTLEEFGHLRTLVNQLLLLSESDAGRMAGDAGPVRLDQVLAKGCDMFLGVAEAAGVELKVGSLEPIEVRGDSQRLRQVVNNLLDNAIKFNHSGGSVTVEMRILPDSREAVFRVADTGVGVPAEELPRMFERFYRGDKSRQRTQRVGGSGLGLSICDAIVAAHGGRIELQSEVGRGTTVKVFLPLPVEHIAGGGCKPEAIAAAS